MTYIICEIELCLLFMSITPPTRQVIDVSQAKQSAVVTMKLENLSFVIYNRSLRDRPVFSRFVTSDGCVADLAVCT